MKKNLFRKRIYFLAVFGLGVWPVAAQATTCPSAPPVSSDNLINMKDFGAIPEQGSALDTAPLLDCALTFARSHKLRTIYFGYGTYTFDTPPQQIDFPITIAGDGKSRTYLARNYNASSPSQGLLTFVGMSPGSPFAMGSAGSSVKDLAIVAQVSSSHGSAISLIGGPNSAPDFSIFSNLYLGAMEDPSNPPSGGNWDNTVYIDGRARIEAPIIGVSPIIGVRDVEFQNCSVFGAANGAMLLEGVVAFNFIGGGIFQAGGVPGTSGKVSISPSYIGPHVCDSGPFTQASGLPSYYVNINSTFVDGILMQASCNGHFSAYFTDQITTSSFSSDDIVIGHVEKGGVQPFWQHSKYIDPEN